MNRTYCDALPILNFFYLAEIYLKFLLVTKFQINVLLSVGQNLLHQWKFWATSWRKRKNQSSFSLFNWIFTKFNICHCSKRVRTWHPATSCVRDHNASKTHVRHSIFKLSPIHASVIYQISWIHWIQFREFLFHLGKTPLQLSKYSITASLSLTDDTCTF